MNKYVAECVGTFLLTLAVNVSLAHEFPVPTAIVAALTLASTCSEMCREHTSIRRSRLVFSPLARLVRWKPSTISSLSVWALVWQCS
jgi:hypothetical protein